MRFVFATQNPGKVREVAGILSGLDAQVVGLRDAGIAGDLPEETGETFLDNAVIKAVHAWLASGERAFADDSGLEVLALGGAPGVRSARYAAAHDDGANLRKLVADLQGVPDRRARFVCTVACLLRAGDVPTGVAAPSGVERIAAHPLLPAGADLWVARGEVAGRIIDTPRGTDGFGYDPIFFRDDLGLTFAQIPAARKNELSHRGHAFRALRGLIERL